MDLLAVLRVAVRRWYVFVPILSLAAILAFTIQSRINPTYTATGSALFVSTSTTRDDGTPFNPLLESAGSVGAAPAVLQVAMSGREEAERLAARGFNGPYTVVVADRQPLLYLTAEAQSPRGAINFVNQLLADADSVLQAQQLAVGAPNSTLVDLRPLAEPLVEASNASLLRARVVILGLGLVAAAGAALLVDRLSRRPRRSTAVSIEAASREAATNQVSS